MIHSAEEFVGLRNGNDERATNDSAPEGVWLDVIKNHPDFKEWVAHNKTVPSSVLSVLASDADPRVRFVVAMKRQCPPELLEQLATDEDETVRVRVAYNKKAPDSALAILRRDPSPLVQNALAGLIE